jgi:hypothetical protein
MQVTDPIDANRIELPIAAERLRDRVEWLEILELTDERPFSEGTGGRFTLNPARQLGNETGGIAAARFIRAPIQPALHCLSTYRPLAVRQAR